MVSPCPERGSHVQNARIVKLKRSLYEIKLKLICEKCVESPTVEQLKTITCLPSRFSETWGMVSPCPERGSHVQNARIVKLKRSLYEIKLKLICEKSKLLNSSHKI